MQNDAAAGTHQPFHQLVAGTTSVMYQPKAKTLKTATIQPTAQAVISGGQETRRSVKRAQAADSNVTGKTAKAIANSQSGSSISIVVRDGDQ